MKVLFCVRHNFHSAPGGAQIQILKTIDNLKSLGVSCHITTKPKGITYNEYDIIHLTDLTWVYENLVYLEEIKKQKFKGKTVLSTIYWPFDDYALNGAPFFQKLIFSVFGINGFEFAKSLGKFVTQRNHIYLNGIKNTFIENQRKIATSVDWLLPNAELEMSALNKRLSLDLSNYSIVNNAIDISIFSDLLRNSTVERKRDLITFVARIDPRKNQLNFLKAMMNNDYLIRFIGNPGPNSQAYYRKVKRLADKRGNVEFISHITQKEVFLHMLESKLHVLTSWVETPGLVSLEAAYAGANILISNRGSVSEYFKDYAFYCEPNDIHGISKMIDKAMTAHYDDSFREIIESQYSWKEAAEQTLNAYNKILNGK